MARGARGWRAPDPEGPVEAQRLVAIALLAGSLTGGWALARGRPAPAPEAPRTPAPLVRVAAVARGDVRVAIRAHGTVAPRNESDLVPEVSGRVVSISPALAGGGFFDAGEVLLEIDPRDYQSALRRAQARLARAASELELARANLGRRSALRDEGAASQAALDDAQNAARVAEAARAEAAAARDEARRNLERCRLPAPYAGRVREEHVDVGQFVSAGQPVARIYAVDYAEVRLPVRDADLAHLDLALGPDADGPPAPQPPVVLRARFAGAQREWTGRIVRTGGEIDPRSRMVSLVARVDDPYGRERARGRPPLAVGLFVDAEIFGRRVERAFRLPRVALREGPSGARDRVLVVDADDRLRFREVEVLRSEREEVVIGEGLAAGERVCVSPLRAAVDGMSVRVPSGDPGLAAAAP